MTTIHASTLRWGSNFAAKKVFVRVLSDACGMDHKSKETTMGKIYTRKLDLTMKGKMTGKWENEQLASPLSSFVERILKVQLIPRWFW